LYSGRPPLPIGVAVAIDGTGQTIIGNRLLEEILGMPEGSNLSLAAPEGGTVA
jgi:hypothetical protein